MQDLHAHVYVPLGNAITARTKPRSLNVRVIAPQLNQSDDLTSGTGVEPPIRVLLGLTPATAQYGPAAHAPAVCPQLEKDTYWASATSDHCCLLHAH